VIAPVGHQEAAMRRVVLVVILVVFASPAAAQITPTVENRLQTMCADTYNVKAFTGSSVAARIDAAIAAAAAAGGGTILIPATEGAGEQTSPLPANVRIIDLRAGYKAPITVQANPSTSAFGKAQGLKLLTSGYGDSMRNPNSPDFVNLYSFIDSIGPGYVMRGPIWSENLLAGVNWQHDTQAWGSEIDVNNDAQVVGEPKVAGEYRKHKVGLGVVSGGYFPATVAFHTGVVNGINGYGWERGINLAATRLTGLRLTAYSNQNVTGTVLPYRGLDVGDFAPRMRSVEIVSAVRRGNAVMLTTSQDLGTIVGQPISVFGVVETGANPKNMTRPFDGEFTIRAISGTTITYADARPNATGAGGSVTHIAQPAAAALRQLRNGEQTFVVQRRTDSGHSGTLLRGLSADAGTEVFALSTSGDLNLTSVDAEVGTLYVGRNRAVNTEIGGVGRPVRIHGAGLSPSTPAGATQTGRVFQGSGAPKDTDGSNGDVYFRTDTPAVANQRIYMKSSGSWVGIL
jgi:hypothetical protein